MINFETVVKPLKGFGADVKFRIQSPKHLHALNEVDVVVAYDPSLVGEIYSVMNDTSLITIWPAPVYMASRGYSPYLAKDVRSFKGYLSRFEPAGMMGSPEVPEIVVTFTPLEPVL